MIEIRTTEGILVLVAMSHIDAVIRRGKGCEILMSSGLVYHAQQDYEMVKGLMHSGGYPVQKVYEEKNSGT